MEALRERKDKPHIMLSRYMGVWIIINFPSTLDVDRPWQKAASYVWELNSREQREIKL